jgi:hypothetical protein
VPRLAGAVKSAAPGRGCHGLPVEAASGLAEDAKALASDQPPAVELCEAVALRLASTVNAAHQERIDAAPNAATGASSAPHTTRAPSWPAWCAKACALRGLPGMGGV